MRMYYNNKKTACQPFSMRCIYFICSSTTCQDYVCGATFTLRRLHYNCLLSVPGELQSIHSQLNIEQILTRNMYVIYFHHTADQLRYSYQELSRHTFMCRSAMLLSTPTCHASASPISRWTILPKSSSFRRPYTDRTETV